MTTAKMILIEIKKHAIAAEEQLYTVKGNVISVNNAVSKVENA